MEIIEIAESLIGQGLYSDAKDLLNRFLEDEPDNNEAVCLIGIALTESGENDKAIKALHYCLSKDENNAAAWEALGCAWMRKNMLDEATTALDMAIKLEPGNWSVKRNIGVLNILKRDYKKAKEFLEAAREKKPEDYKAIYALIYTFINLRDYQGAEKLIFFIQNLDIPKDVRSDVEHLLVRIQSKLI